MTSAVYKMKNKGVSNLNTNMKYVTLSRAKSLSREARGFFTPYGRSRMT